MNRRGVLKGLGAAAAAGLWPGWLNEAFAGAPCGVLRGTATLAAAIQRAHGALKPLAVLVIPKDDVQKWDRGQHLGEWLNFGSDRDLASLACASVVCAEMAAVRQLFPSAPADAEPAVLVANVDRSPARVSVALEGFAAHEDVTVKRVDSDAVESMSEDERLAYFTERREQLGLQEDASIQPCIDRTGAAIRQAILGDAGALRSRADARWERLTASERDLARKLLGGADGLPLDVVAVAPLLASAAAERGGQEAERLTRLLAQAARFQYCDQRIAGSKWALASGCGTTIEGEENELMVMCGMGHVPRRSRRFLHFFTK